MESKRAYAALGAPTAERPLDREALAALVASVQPRAVSPERPCWCAWTCCHTCACGPCCHPGAPPQLRAARCQLDCFAWMVGMAAPSARPFDRQAMLRINRMQVPPGEDAANGLVALDLDVPPRRAGGRVVPVRVYKPSRAGGGPGDAGARLPVMYFIHGGGFCVGTRDAKVHDALCREYAKRGFVVVALSYALAPEHPFPAAVHDCWEVLAWISDSAPSEDAGLPACADRERLVLGGDSAGGNLACVMATLLRDSLDSDLQPCALKLRASHLLLIYPVVYLVDPETGLDMLDRGRKNRLQLLGPLVSRFFSVSYMDLEAKAVGGGEEGGESAHAKYVRLIHTERRIAPLLCGAHGLPPTTIVSGGFDRFHVENEETFKLLRAAGVPVVLRHYPRGFHSFATTPACPEYRAQIDASLEDLDHVLHPDAGFSRWRSRASRGAAAAKGVPVEEQGGF